MASNSKQTQLQNQPMLDSNVLYKHQNSVHENYWFQDLSGTLFNLDYLVKILPTEDMTYPEKINALIRLSIYIGIILALFYTNYLFLYIPIITMLATYILYLFRIEQLDNSQKGAGAGQSQIDLVKQNIIGQQNYNILEPKLQFEKILNISHCSKPSLNNPFMNPLPFDSRLRDSACDVIKPENQLKIEKEYNKHCIKDASDIWNHNSGRREFYTMPNTTYPSNQGAFANWLYRTGPSCKDGNGTQCVGNLPIRLNSSLISPSFSQ